MSSNGKSSTLRHRFILLPIARRTAQQEDVIRRIRYPRHVARDHLVRPYVPHEAMGFFILNVTHLFSSLSLFSIDCFLALE